MLDNNNYYLLYVILGYITFNIYKLIFGNI